MNESMSIDKSNVVAIARWLDANPGVSNREAARQLGIHESYVRRAKSARPEGQSMRLQIADVRRESSTQPRVAICRETVERYAVAKRNGAKFLPSVVFFDGQHHWMGDGFHRTEADVAVGLTEAEFIVHHGGEVEAFAYGLLSNNQNGLALNSADRKRAYHWLWANEPGQSGREYARRVGVDEKQVRRWREEADNASEDEWEDRLTSGELAAYDRADARGDAVGEYQYKYQQDAVNSVLGEMSDPDPAPPLPSLAVDRPTPKLPDPEPDSADNSAEDDEWEGETEEPRPLTDGEWLATLDAYRALEGLTTQAVFARDALLYRHYTETEDYQRQARLARKLMEDRKSVGLRGRFHGKLSAFVRVKHPASWLVCGLCKGSGCDTCRRGGYAID